jgi:chromatin assembly factor 1 subunit B
VLPSPDQFTIAVRFCPLLFELKESKAKPVFSLPYRMIFAIATKCSVYLYDTQQKIPFGLISNIHYTRLTDLSWSNDGRILLVSSTDGFCSIIQFADGELGKVYKEQSIQEIISIKTVKEETKKKKKAKKPSPKTTNSAAVDLNKSNVTEKEQDAMDVDEDSVAAAEISPLNNLSQSIKEIIPVDKIIKSNQMFSPEKQSGSPATPIQVRKCPRVPEELKDKVEDEKKLTPAKNASEPCSSTTTTTPKASTIHSKTPNRLEVRRFPRTMLQPVAAPPVVNIVKESMSVESSMERKMHQSAEKMPTASPKTPRRVEFRTITTPKSKKRLL